MFVLLDLGREWPLSGFFGDRSFGRDNPQNRYGSHGFRLLPARLDGTTGSVRPRTESQRQAVADFFAGGSWRHVAELVEVESGSRDARPRLSEALALCRLHGATLVIAKLDRLSGDAAFLLNLQKAVVRFVAADMSEANELVVGIMVVVAQAERKMISARTKAALAAAKARGARVGKPENLSNRQTGQARGRTQQAHRAEARARDLAPMIAAAWAEGAVSLRQIAAALNARGIPAARGEGWSAAQIQRVLGST